MKKNLFIVIIILFTISFSQLYADNYNGSKTVVAYVQPNSGQSYYAYGTFGIDIGYKYVSEAQESEKARTKFTFDLTGIPASSTITSVSLSYVTSSYINGSYKFKITQISNKISPQDIWQNIGQATALFSDIYYSSGSLNSSSLTSLVNSNKGGNMYLGAFSQNESKTDSYANLSLTLTVTFTGSITADNNFTAPNGTNGIIIVNGTQRDAPYTIQNVTVGSNETLQAVSPQTDNQGYQVIWHTGSTNASNWTRDGVFVNPNQTYNFTVAAGDFGKTFQANLRKVTNITFQNNFIGVGNGGVIKVNNTQVSSPTASYSVVELNPITATAVSQSFNNIAYYFTNWSTGSTNSTETFYPTANTTITANFVGIAAQSVALNFESSNPNLPITLHWNEYPNDNVTQYQVWRRVKYKKETTGDPVLLATVLRGTTNYIDYDYRGSSSGFTDWMLWYDVRSYYSTEGTYPDPNWAQVFSDGPLMKATKDTTELLSTVNINSLNNYPNPFNPSTVIKYQIVKAGHVTLKVYDTLGREVANLVDKEQPSGRYSVNFNASSLASGIYLYRITANGFTAVKKMLLMK